MSGNRVQDLNPNAEIVSKQACLAVNVAAATGLQGVLKTNLGPRGTLKMLVGGAGECVAGWMVGLMWLGVVVGRLHVMILDACWTQ